MNVTLKPMEFSYSENKLSAIMIDDQPYILAKQFCDILGYKNNRATLKSLDDDEKLTYEILTSGQKRRVNLINEAGMYKLLLRSNKPEAKAFSKWVTHEVLPTLRREGSYTIHKQKGLAEQGSYNEDQLFVANLGGWMTHSYYTGGVLYSSLAAIGKYLKFQTGISKTIREKINQKHLIQIDLGGQQRWFISLDGVEELLQKMKETPNYASIKAIYNLFGHGLGFEGKEDEYVFKYTSNEMHRIENEILKKPVNKLALLALLKKGGSI